MRKYHIICGLLLSALPMAAESPFRPIIASVVDGNNTILAGEASISAALESARAENTLEGPEIEFEHLWASGSSDKKWNIGVTQEFAWPGLYSARSAAARADAEASRLVLLGVKADKALAAKQLIIDLVNAHARLEYYTDVRTNLDRIAALVQKSYDLGEATILDLRKTKLALIDSDRALTDIRADIATLRSSLEGLGAALPEGDAVFGAYPVQDCSRPTRETDALLYAIHDAETAASAAKSKAVRFEAWPTLAVGYRHAFEESQHFNGLSVALRLPSFSQGKRRRAAALEAEALSMETSARIVEETAENSGLYSAAVALAAGMERYRELSGDNSYLSLLAKAYDGGELTVIDYLNEVNLFTGARLNYLDLEYRYNQTLARLNRYRSMDF